MRSTCSLYVDAGYLLASAATRVAGTSLRSGIHVEYGAMIAALIAEAEARAGLPILRVHWYDSATNGVPNPQQERIGELAKVKLRLGRFGYGGEQKGVDLRLGLDMVTHARNGASDVFFLVSGDDDLTEAVEEAQGHGVEVVLLGVPDAGDKAHGVNRHLIRAADDLVVLPSKMIDKVVMRVEVPPKVEAVVEPIVEAKTVVPVQPRPVPTAPNPLNVPVKARPAVPVPSATPVYSGATGQASKIAPGYDGVDAAAEFDEQIDAVVTQVLTALRLSATPGALADLVRGRPSIPRDLDRALLVDLSDAIGMSDLTDPIRFRLRDRFWEQVDRG